jgi:hypothetical protein
MTNGSLDPTPSPSTGIHLREIWGSLTSYPRLVFNQPKQGLIIIPLCPSNMMQFNVLPKICPQSTQTRMNLQLFPPFNIRQFQVIPTTTQSSKGLIISFPLHVCPKGRGSLKSYPRQLNQPNKGFITSFPLHVSSKRTRQFQVIPTTTQPTQ